MSAALEVQKGIRSRLTAFPALVALVPPDNVFDRHGRPAAFPCITLGEGQEVPADIVARRHFLIHCTLHVWTREPGTTTAKAIAGAIRQALASDDLELEACRCLDLRFGGARFLRDPDGETAHAIVTIEALVEEPAQ